MRGGGSDQYMPDDRARHKKTSHLCRTAARVQCVWLVSSFPAPSPHQGFRQKEGWEFQTNHTGPTPATSPIHHANPKIFKSVARGRTAWLCLCGRGWQTNPPCEFARLSVPASSPSLPPERLVLCTYVGIPSSACGVAMIAWSCLRGPPAQAHSLTRPRLESVWCFVCVLL